MQKKRTDLVQARSSSRLEGRQGFYHADDVSYVNQEISERLVKGHTPGRG